MKPLVVVVLAPELLVASALDPLECVDGRASRRPTLAVSSSWPVLLVFASLLARQRLSCSARLSAFLPVVSRRGLGGRAGRCLTVRWSGESQPRLECRLGWRRRWQRWKTSGKRDPRALADSSPIKTAVMGRLEYRRNSGPGGESLLLWCRPRCTLLILRAS